jgi:hypothetical protein
MRSFIAFHDSSTSNMAVGLLFALDELARRTTERQTAANAGLHEEHSQTYVGDRPVYRRERCGERPVARIRLMATALDNGQRSPRKLLAVVVRRLILGLRRTQAT